MTGFNLTGCKAVTSITSLFTKNQIIKYKKNIIKGLPKPVILGKLVTFLVALGFMTPINPSPTCHNLSHLSLVESKC